MEQNQAYSPETRQRQILREDGATLARHAARATEWSRSGRPVTAVLPPQDPEYVALVSRRLRALDIPAK